MSENNYCVYAHLNRITGNIYIGQTGNIETRWDGKGQKYGGKMKEAIDKYGFDSFDHFIIKDNLTKKQAYFWERHYIDKFNSVKNGYNTEPAAMKSLTLYDPETEKTFYFESRSKAGEFVWPRNPKEGHNAILRALSEDRGEDKAKGYYCFDGRLSVQEAKKRLEERRKTSRNNVGLIVHYPDGTEKQYESVAVAAKDMGLNYQTLKSRIRFKSHADGITYTVLKQKEGIKATKFGKVRFFESGREFARFEKCSPSNVYAALKRPDKRTVHGWKLEYCEI